MSPTPSFADLMARLENRDDQAAQIVYDRFAEKLIRAVREQLSRKYQSKIDPESVVLSACRSFFAHRAKGEYPDVEDWDQLWKLLLVMARHKLADRRDRFQAACRDVDREVSLDGLREQVRDYADPVDPNPTPADVALLADEVECLCNSFRHWNLEYERSLRLVLEMHLQRCSRADIGLVTGYSNRSIERILTTARKRLEGMLGLDGKNES